MIEVELPDGRVVEIDTTDTAVAAQAAQRFLASSAPKAPETGMLEDAAKSVGSGLASATAGTLGAAGDLRSLLSAGTSALGDKLGVGSDKIQAFKDLAASAAGLTTTGRLLANAPTSRDIINTAADPIVSPDYQPQTDMGRFLKKGAEFAPNMLVGGPEGLAARFLTNVAAPAVGSEIGDRLAGPYGGAAGALAGGAGASSIAQKFNQMAAARRAASALPSGDRLVEAGGAGFNRARDMNVVVTPDWATSAAAKMRSDLKGFDPEAQGVVFKAADRLENLGKSSAPAMTPAQRLQAEMNWEPIPQRPPAPPVEINEVEMIRQQLSSMKTDTNASVREAARKAITSLQESQSALTPTQTLRGDASAYTQTLKDAIANYAAGKRSQTVQGKINLADLNANSPVGALDSGTSGQALQRTMKQLARPVNNTNVPVAKKLGFNDKEVGAIKAAADGTKMQNAAELMERLIPANFGAVPAMIARQIGGLTTKRQVAALDSLVRSNSPLGAQVAAQMPKVAERLSPKTQSLLTGLIPAALASPQ
jgi:hypothetical protein